MSSACIKSIFCGRFCDKCEILRFLRKMRKSEILRQVRDSAD
ncbi:hypothetical protein [Helicobacter sp. 23-1045]